ncbi:early activation antigen CD69 [Echinops telfairi]|uniref:Early activation antigen CD69 n=1 Tax=Echinops telfairi TaxID=9371 RepID=A0ABM0ZTY7_ECHTE|nr:early activation antigen CD69 [Echinops telfairi]
MIPEDSSMTENSSLHPEKGQQSNATSSHFSTHHEGSLQVPIPCAVVTVVIITILSIALIALIEGQYNCPGHSTALVPSDSPASPCSAGWIGSQKKCYHLSTKRSNWTMAQGYCSEHGATLALLDSEKEMIFLKQYMSGLEHWIGMNNETGQTWKWSNGRELNNRSSEMESGNCPFFNTTDVSSTACQRRLHWICSKPSHQ